MKHKKSAPQVFPGSPTGRILSPMTLARTHAHGLVSPSPLQHWLNATLCVLAELVHSVAAMLGMRNRRQARECDTIQMPEALPQATHDTQLQEANSTHGVILGPVPRISVGPTRGLAIIPREAINQDARHKSGHDTVDVVSTKGARSGTAGLPPGTRCNAAPPACATTCAFSASAGQEPGGPIRLI